MKKLTSSFFGLTLIVAALCCMGMPVPSMVASDSKMVSGHDCCHDITRLPGQKDSTDCTSKLSEKKTLLTQTVGIEQLTFVSITPPPVTISDINDFASKRFLVSNLSHGPPGDEYIQRKNTIVLRT